MKPLPPPNWSRIFALPHQLTAKARVFRALSGGGWIPGSRLVEVGGGWDYRTRCARLRDLGIPIVSRECDYSNCHEFRIEPEFLDQMDAAMQERRTA